MAVLSDRDIVGELGEGILFHPLKPGSIKVCRLCLTASEHAYALNQRQRIPIQVESSRNNPGEECKYFLIPVQDTALIWTDEAVFLSDYLCGSIHSRVGLVAQGVGHIGTTVNPRWTGVLCVAVHNLSNNPIRVNVRDTKESIAYLIIHRLSSRSSTKGNIDSSARLDILEGLSNADEIYRWFNRPEHKWMLDDTGKLKALLKSSNEYKELKKSSFQDLVKSVNSTTGWTALQAIATLLSVGIALFALFANSSNRQPNPLPSASSNPTSKPKVKQTISVPRQIPKP